MVFLTFQPPLCVTVTFTVQRPAFNAVILPLEKRHTDLDFLVTTNDARAVVGMRIPSESAIVRAVLEPSVTKYLLALLPDEADTGTVFIGTVVLVVLVTEVSAVGHLFGVGVKPLMGFPGQPVLPCS